MMRTRASSRSATGWVIVLWTVAACTQVGTSFDNERPGAGLAERKSHSHEDLAPFDPQVGAGISPERVVGRGSGDYDLEYVSSADGSAIETRYRGPSEALSAGLRVRRRSDGDTFRLVAVMAGTAEDLATLARWKLDGSGRITDAYVRVTPVVEIRPRDLKPGQLVANCDWRPLVRGEPVGDWRSR